MHRYIPSEVLNGQVTDLPKADMFMLGITLYELTTCVDLPTGRCLCVRLSVVLCITICVCCCMLMSVLHKFAAISKLTHLRASVYLWCFRWAGLSKFKAGRT